MINAKRALIIIGIVGNLSLLAAIWSWPDIHIGWKFLWTAGVLIANGISAWDKL